MTELNRWRWMAMKKRCDNPNDSSYANYGGRGITYHIDFIDRLTYCNYIESLEFANLPGRTVDRMDNDGNYTYGNLRWATKSEQELNKRSWVLGEADEELVPEIIELGWMNTITGAKSLRALKYKVSQERYKKLRDQIWPLGKPKIGGKGRRGGIS